MLATPVHWASWRAGGVGLLDDAAEMVREEHDGACRVHRREPGWSIPGPGTVRVMSVVPVPIRSDSTLHAVMHVATGRPAGVIFGTGRPYPS